MRRRYIAAIVVAVPVVTIAVTINSHSGNVPHTYILPNSVVLIKTDHELDYGDGDIYAEFKHKRETLIAV